MVTTTHEEEEDEEGSASWMFETVILLLPVSGWEMVVLLSFGWRTPVDDSTASVSVKRTMVFQIVVTAGTEPSSVVRMWVVAVFGFNFTVYGRLVVMTVSVRLTLVKLGEGKRLDFALLLLTDCDTVYSERPADVIDVPTVSMVSGGIGKIPHASVLSVSDVADSFVSLRAMIELSGISYVIPSRVYPVPLKAQTASPALSEVS